MRATTKTDCRLPIVRGAAAVAVLLFGAVVVHAAPAISGPPEGLHAEWLPVAQSAIRPTLEMLAEQMRGNFERIKTWVGTYSVSTDDLASPQLVAQLQLGSRAPVTGPLRSSVTFDVDFAIDVATGRVFRDQRGSELNWYRPGSQESIKIPHVAPVSGRSLVTSEKYVHFNETNVVPELGVLRRNPQAERKRVGYIDPPAEARKQDYGDLPDLLELYDVGGWRAWQLLDNTVKLMPAQRAELSRWKSPAGEDFYRLSLFFGDPKKPSYRDTTIFSAGDEFGPVEDSTTFVLNGSKPVNAYRWQWKRYGGILAPAEVETWFYDPAITPGVKFHRKVVLQKCVFNAPLDPNQFSYQAIGLKDGDVLVNNLTRQVQTIKDSGPVKLGDFGEKYVPPPRATGKWAISRSIVTILLLLLVIALSVAVWRRRRAVRA